MAHPPRPVDLTRLTDMKAEREPWMFLETRPTVGEALLDALRENA